MNECNQKKWHSKRGKKENDATEGMGWDGVRGKENDEYRSE